MESDQGKLFVGGISRETTEGTLKDHFSKYGNFVSSVVAKDRNTKSPRGFGFVLFSEPSSADKALQDTHVILGRTVSSKLSFLTQSLIYLCLFTLFSCCEKVWN